MNSLPGGRLAPPPPISRIAVGGLAFLLTACFSFAWAGVEVLETLTTKESSIRLMGATLERATNEALVEEIRKDPNAPEFEVINDLVKFKVTREAVNDINISEVLARQRAAELWVNNYPKDPGPEHTLAGGLPRSFLTMFTEFRHKQMGPAGTAALFGVGAGMLVCAVMATGAARFGLPGASALLGYFILRYHLWFANFWFDKNGDVGPLFQVNIKLAANDPAQKVLFVAVALLAAGLVYSVLLGGTRSLIGGARGGGKKLAAAKAKAKKKKAKAAAAAAAAAAYAAAQAEGLDDEDDDELDDEDLDDDEEDELDDEEDGAEEVGS